jgi:hypothetical protein
VIFEADNAAIMTATIKDSLISTKLMTPEEGSSGWIFLGHFSGVHKQSTQP